MATVGAIGHAGATPQKYEEWTVQCKTGVACVAHLDRDGVQILVGRTKAGAPVRMSFRIPAVTKKGDPVALRLNDGWHAGLIVGGCRKNYCEASISEKSTDVAIAALSRNSSGLIAYEAKGRIQLIPFPLGGFAEALTHVRK